MTLHLRITKALSSGRGIRLSHQELTDICGTYVPLHSGDRLKDALHLAGCSTGLNVDANREMSLAFFAAYGVDLDDVVEMPVSAAVDARDRQAMLNGLDSITATVEDLDDWVMEYRANQRREELSNNNT